MNATIVGAGNMGRAISTRAIAGGHRVEIVDRDPAEARALAGSSAAPPPHPTRRLHSVETSLSSPSTTQGSRRLSVSTLIGLAGKIVVDITNPIDTETWDGLATPAGTSFAQEVAQLLPEDTRVVKAFNTTSAGTLIEGEVAGHQLDVLIAGDDADAKQKLSQIVSDGGLRPIDVGPLSRAQQLEQLGFLHMSLQEPLGLSFGSTVKLHP